VFLSWWQNLRCNKIEVSEHRRALAVVPLVSSRGVVIFMLGVVMAVCQKTCVDVWLCSVSFYMKSRALPLNSKKAGVVKIKTLTGIHVLYSRKVQKKRVARPILLLRT
jgi:hypothetical protein